MFTLEQWALNMVDPFGVFRNAYSIGSCIANQDAYAFGEFVGNKAGQVAQVVISAGVAKGAKVVSKAIGNGFTIEEAGRIADGGRKGYPGIKYFYKKGNGTAVRSVELHPNHNSHGIHLQYKKWNPISGTSSTYKRTRLW